MEGWRRGGAPPPPLHRLFIHVTHIIACSVSVVMSSDSDSSGSSSSFWFSEVENLTLFRSRPKNSSPPRKQKSHDST